MFDSHTCVKRLGMQLSVGFILVVSLTSLLKGYLRHKGKWIYMLHIQPFCHFVIEPSFSRPCGRPITFSLKPLSLLWRVRIFDMHHYSNTVSMDVEFLDEISSFLGMGALNASLGSLNVTLRLTDMFFIRWLVMIFLLLQIAKVL